MSRRVGAAQASWKSSGGYRDSRHADLNGESVEGWVERFHGAPHRLLRRNNKSRLASPRTAPRRPAASGYEATLERVLMPTITPSIPLHIDGGGTAVLHVFFPGPRCVRVAASEDRCVFAPSHAVRRVYRCSGRLRGATCLELDLIASISVESWLASVPYECNYSKLQPDCGTVCEAILDLCA